VRQPIRVLDPAERTLALALLDFGSVVSQVSDRLESHRLCGYLFDHSQTFPAFYENCPVLKAEPATRESRFSLCGLTVRVLVQGLDLLGVEAPERM
jgi:arginyl-tRNA synthetase